MSEMISVGGVGSFYSGQQSKKMFYEDKFPIFWSKTQFQEFVRGP